MGRPPTHGLSNTPTWNSWMGMITRCTNPRLERWKFYGGKGIKVCERWIRFENFMADMGERPNGASLDRIDRDGNYEPSNCKWSSAKEQAVNRSTTKTINFNGEVMCKADWAKRLGITPFALNERLRKWPIERALTAPHGPFGPKAR